LIKIKRMRILATIILIFIFSNRTFCQQKPITKKELKTLIKEGIAAGNGYSWEICNGSTAVKKDTLIVKIPQVYDCANFTGWHFESYNKIWQTTTKRELYTTTSGWREYTFESTPVTPTDIFNIKILNIDSKLVIERFNNGKLIDSFQVISYTKEGYNNATLLLVKQ